MPKPQVDLIKRDGSIAIDAQNFILRDLEAIVRKGRHIARDGFPASSRGSDGGSTEVSRPTENVAIADPMFDPTARDIKDLLVVLKEIYQLTQRGTVLRDRIMQPEDSKGLRTSSLTECKACNRAVSNVENDRIHGAGYCASCYAAFARYRQNLPTTDLVDFAYFERTRREYLAEKARQPDTVAS